MQTKNPSAMSEVTTVGVKTVTVNAILVSCAASWVFNLIECLSHLVSSWYNKVMTLAELTVMSLLTTREKMTYFTVP